MSYLVDQSKAREAGRALFGAVYDKWSTLPSDRRPRESVGPIVWWSPSLALHEPDWINEDPGDDDLEYDLDTVRHLMAGDRRSAVRR
jgi:uncharacterized membrane protein